MQKHPHFDLWLHDNDELSEIIGTPVIERMTIHEWPLSCVQRLHLAENETRIYKVQSEPTVEPDFYQHASSLLLVGSEVIPNNDRPSALLLEDGSRGGLSKQPQSKSDKLAFVNELIPQINQIEGAIPYIVNISTHTQWLRYAMEIVQQLHVLVDHEIFKKVDRAMITLIEAAVQSPRVLAALDEPTGYVHTDLTEDNIIILSDGYRVLDWQRPIWGPVDLDRLVLLESLGIDPSPHVSIGIRRLRLLLQIGWFAETALKWFPAGSSGYDDTIAQLAHQLKRMKHGVVLPQPNF